MKELASILPWVTAIFIRQSKNRPNIISTKPNVLVTNPYLRNLPFINLIYIALQTLVIAATAKPILNKENRRLPMAHLRIAVFGYYY